MARLQLTFPDAIIYSTELGVRASDLNYGGHLGHDAVLTLMQEARVQFYRYQGFENEVKFEGTIGQVIADVSVVYKSESFLGDILVIEISVTDFNKYGFDMYYRMTNKATGREVAVGKTGIVCFDYERKKVAPVPPVLMARLR